MLTTTSWCSTPLILTKTFTPPQSPKSFYGATKTAAPNFPIASFFSVFALLLCF